MAPTLIFARVIRLNLTRLYRVILLSLILRLRAIRVVRRRLILGVRRRLAFIKGLGIVVARWRAGSVCILMCAFVRVSVRLLLVRRRLVSEYLSRSSSSYGILERCEEVVLQREEECGAWLCLY